MPQAPARLSHLDEQTCWNILEEHYGEHRGFIYPKNPNRPETPQETDAIDYLCTEWDFGYEDLKPDA